MYGNVWEWVEDHFNGLPGFKTTYLYDDFSTPCFDGRHTMITVSELNKERKPVTVAAVGRNGKKPMFAGLQFGIEGFREGNMATKTCH